MLHEPEQSERERTAEGKANVAGRMTYILGRVPPPYGGVSVFIQRRIDKSRAQGESVELIPLSRPALLLYRLLTSARSPNAYFEVHSLRLPLLLLMALTGHLRQTVVWDHNHSRSFGSASKLGLVLMRRLLKRVNQLVLVGDHLRSNYERHDIGLPAVVRTELPFVEPDLRRDQEIFGSYPQALKQFMVQRTPLLLMPAWRVALGRIHDTYGIVAALRAVADLERTHPRLGLVIAVGDHRNSDTSTIQSRARDIGVEDRIFVLEGDFEVWPLMRRVDLLLRLTDTDGDSVSLREALSLDCRVLASNVVPRPHGVITYRHADHEDLMAQLKVALASPQLP